MQGYVSPDGVAMGSFPSTVLAISAGFDPMAGNEPVALTYVQNREQKGTIMNRKVVLILEVVALLGAIGWTGCAQKSGSEGAAEKAGAALDRAAENTVDAAQVAAEKTKVGAEKAVQKTGEAMEKAGAAVEQTGEDLKK